MFNCPAHRNQGKWKCVNAVDLKHSGPQVAAILVHPTDVLVISHHESGKGL